MYSKCPPAQNPSGMTMNTSSLGSPESPGPSVAPAPPQGTKLRQKQWALRGSNDLTLVHVSSDTHCERLSVNTNLFFLVPAPQAWGDSERHHRVPQ